MDTSLKKLTKLNSFLNESSKFNIIIEGNIAAGKTTLLKYFDQIGQTKISTFGEPLEQWTNMHGYNLLDLLYQDTSNWAFAFQNYAMLTMMQNHIKEVNQNIKIMERSIFSARYCFIEAQVKLKNIDIIKFEILKEWFNFMTKNIQMKLDLIIYLRTTPNVALERVKKRNRPEEKNMNINYLTLLHELHDNWLINKQFPSPAQIIILNGDVTPEEIIEELESKIKILQIENQ